MSGNRPEPGLRAARGAGGGHRGASGKGCGGWQGWEVTERDGYQTGRVPGAPRSWVGSDSWHMTQPSLAVFARSSDVLNERQNGGTMSPSALIRGGGAVPGLCLGPDDPLRLPEMEPGPPASGGRQTGEQGSRAWVAAERYRTRKGRGISCSRWEPCGARRPFLTFQTLLAPLTVSPSSSSKSSSLKAL